MPGRAAVPLNGHEAPWNSSSTSKEADFGGKVDTWAPVVLSLEADGLAWPPRPRYGDSTPVPRPTGATSDGSSGTSSAGACLALNQPQHGGQSDAVVPFTFWNLIS